LLDRNCYLNSKVYVSCNLIFNEHVSIFYYAGDQTLRFEIDYELKVSQSSYINYLAFSYC
jgi:hypothetical protein